MIIIHLTDDLALKGFQHKIIFAVSFSKSFILTFVETLKSNEKEFTSSLIVSLHMNWNVFQTTISFLQEPVS